MAMPEALQRAGSAGAHLRSRPRLDERCVGALMMHFVLETILAARLMGVDPFDQPAVELAKVITRERVAALPNSARPRRRLRAIDAVASRRYDARPFSASRTRYATSDITGIDPISDQVCHGCTLPC